MSGRSEHKELTQKAFLILIEKCVQGMQQVWAVWALPASIHPYTMFKNTVFPPENMEVSDHVFSAYI